MDLDVETKAEQKTRVSIRLTINGRLESGVQKMFFSFCWVCTKATCLPYQGDNASVLLSGSHKGDPKTQRQADNPNKRRVLLNKAVSQSP